MNPYSTTSLIPADSVTAVYDSSTEKLELAAEGHIQPVTYDYNFERIMWRGGLKFALTAFTSAIGVPKESFKFQQTFIIPNMLEINPSNTVTIVTEDDSTLVATIKWLPGTDAQGKQQLTSPATHHADEQKSNVLMDDTETLFVRLDFG